MLCCVVCALQEAEKRSERELAASTPYLMTPFACSHAFVSASSSCCSASGYSRASTGRSTARPQLGQGSIGMAVPETDRQPCGSAPRTYQRLRPTVPGLSACDSFILVAHHMHKAAGLSHRVMFGWHGLGHG